MVKPEQAKAALYFLTPDVASHMQLLKEEGDAPKLLKIWQRRIGKEGVKYPTVGEPFCNPYPKVLVKAVVGHWRAYRYEDGKLLERKNRFRATYDFVYT